MKVSRKGASVARALRKRCPSLAVRSRMEASALLKVRSLKNVWTWLTLLSFRSPDFALDFLDDGGPPFREDLVPVESESPLFLAAEALTDGHLLRTIEPPLEGGT